MKKAKDYKKGDVVLSQSRWSNGLRGKIHASYKDYVSVNFGTDENPNFQRFHDLPKHRMQSNINEIELLSDGVAPIPVEGEGEKMCKFCDTKNWNWHDPNCTRPQQISAHQCYKKAQSENMTDTEHKKLLVDNGVIVKSTAKTNDSPKNWVEDYAGGENQYLNQCSICNGEFYGFKQRRVCKECSETPPSANDGREGREQNDRLVYFIERLSDRQWLDYDLNWTNDPHKCFHFTTKERAESWAGSLIQDTYEVTEHMFQTPPSSKVEPLTRIEELKEVLEKICSEAFGARYHYADTTFDGSEKLQEDLAKETAFYQSVMQKLESLEPLPQAPLNNDKTI